MALAPRLQKWFPWTRAPVICNGPMLGAASPALATQVTKAGGIGTGALSPFLAPWLSHSTNSGMILV